MRLELIAVSYSVATDCDLFSCFTYNSCDNTKGNNRGCYLSSSRDTWPRLAGEINTVNQDFIFAGGKNGENDVHEQVRCGLYGRETDVRGECLN